MADETANALEEAKAEKSKIYSRIKEVQAIINITSDSSERIRQTSRLKILRDMYRDACERVDRLKPEAKKKAVPKKIIHTDEFTWNFFERNNLIWSDLEGHTWNAIGKLNEEADAHGAQLLMALIHRSQELLTDRQRFYISKCFGEHKNISQVAEEENVNKSTVYRVVKSGLTRIENAVISSLYATECIEGDTFDHLRWAEVTESLTERQRECLYYLLSKDASLALIADKLELNKSTVSRTNGRIVDRMAASIPILPEMQPHRVVYRREWRNRTEDEIAEMLGISKGTYYRNICRKRPVGSITRFAYECLRRKDQDPKVVAAELGCSSDTVKKYWRKYADLDISEFEEPPDYHPVSIRRKKNVDIRRLLTNITASEGTIGASISAETYIKMLEISK